METKLAGRGANAKVTGAYVGNGRQHLDYDTTQEHAAEDTTSDLAFRGVLDGRSTAVWRGMINVDKGAQRTDAFQDCRNLLLSKRAHADAIPGLQIEADDVACTHAAAVAQIDPEQLFYLTSRGLDARAGERADRRRLPRRAGRAGARRGRSPTRWRARSSAASASCSTAESYCAEQPATLRQFGDSLFGDEKGPMSSRARAASPSRRS